MVYWRMPTSASSFVTDDALNSKGMFSTSKWFFEMQWITTCRKLPLKMLCCSTIVWLFGCGRTLLWLLCKLHMYISDKSKWFVQNLFCFQTSVKHKLFEQFIRTVELIKFFEERKLRFVIMTFIKNAVLMSQFDVHLFHFTIRDVFVFEKILKSNVFETLKYCHEILLLLLASTI